MKPFTRRIFRWLNPWAEALGQRLRPVRSLLMVGLCLSLAITGCGTSSGGLSGNYLDDTLLVAESLLATIALDQESPARPEAETQARELINSYTARYRPRGDVNGLSSFTTMQTALNSLAAHYASYVNRPLPEALRSRLDKELHKAEAAAQRGA